MDSTFIYKSIVSAKCNQSYVDGMVEEHKKIIDLVGRSITVDILSSSQRFIDNVELILKNFKKTLDDCSLHHWIGEELPQELIDQNKAALWKVTRMKKRTEKMIKKEESDGFSEFEEQKIFSPDFSKRKSFIPSRPQLDPFRIDEERSYLATDNHCFMNGTKNFKEEKEIIWIDSDEEIIPSNNISQNVSERKPMFKRELPSPLQNIMSSSEETVEESKLEIELEVRRTNKCDIWQVDDYSNNLISGCDKNHQVHPNCLSKKIGKIKWVPSACKVKMEDSKCSGVIPHPTLFKVVSAEYHEFLMFLIEKNKLLRFEKWFWCDDCRTIKLCNKNKSPRCTDHDKEMSIIDKNMTKPKNLTKFINQNFEVWTDCFKMKKSLNFVKKGSLCSC